MKIDENNTELHDVLLSVVQQFGEEIIIQNQLKNILSDLTAGEEASKFMSVITRAVNYNLGRKLLATKDLNDSDFNLRIMNLRQEFMEDNFLQPEVSDYIVDSFIYALGWGNAPHSYKHREKKLDLPFGFQMSKEGDFIGHLNDNNERHGIGIQGKENGDFYVGQWKFDSKTGIGLEISIDQKKYAGDYRMNRRHGVGVMTFKDGSKYTGEWRNGRRHGWGLTLFPNGEKLYGHYVNDEITNNIGIFFPQDGNIVYGQMSDNGPDGECLRIGHDGSIKTEIWKNGLKQN